MGENKNGFEITEEELEHRRVLSGYSTAELCEELEKRNSVTTISIGLYGEVSTTVKGPSFVYIVDD